MSPLTEWAPHRQMRRMAGELAPAAPIKIVAPKSRALLKVALEVALRVALIWNFLNQHYLCGVACLLGRCLFIEEALQDHPGQILAGILRILSWAGCSNSDLHYYSHCHSGYLARVEKSESVPSANQSARHTHTHALFNKHTTNTQITMRLILKFRLSFSPSEFSVDCPTASQILGQVRRPFWISTRKNWARQIRSKCFVSDPIK